MRGQSVKWTAEVKFSDGSPATGFVVFDASPDTGGLTQLGRVELSNGKASVTAALFAPTTHTIKANYNDQGTDRGNVKGSTDQQQQIVQMPPLAVLLKQDPLDTDLLRRAVSSELAPMDMRSLLGAMTQLQKAGTLDTLLEHLESPQRRIGVAYRTVKGEFDASLGQQLRRLSPDDQQAILESVPDDKKADLALNEPLQPDPDSPDAPKPDSDREVTADFFYVIIPRTDHISTTGDKSHDKPGQSLQYQVNLQIKSVTLTWACQVTVFRDSDGKQTFAVQNVMTGGQVSIDVTPAFIKEILEIDVIAQALAGATRQEVKGSMKMVPTVQGAGGAQIQHKFQLPGTNLSFVVGVQVMGGGTKPSGADATGDVTHQWFLGFEGKF
jgi:hypothetical protein